MSNVIQFRPRAEHDAIQNLAEFVTLCRADIDLLTNDPFEAHSWDVSNALTASVIKHRQHMHFCSWESAKFKTAKRPMSEPYASFAKAFMLYEHSHEKAKSFMPRLTALRVLNDVLCTSGHACVTNLTTAHLDQACSLMQQRLSVESAYLCGTHLERINEFVVDHKLAPHSAPWRQWLPRPNGNRARVGKEYDERRQEKLPSPAAFEALGSIFNIAVDTADILVTCVCALLCGAPSRISEVLRLPVDCQVKQKTPDGAEVLNLRWWPAKGAAPMVKPVVSSMRDVVELAIERLKEITAEGRALARWYTKNPHKLYLGADLEHLRGKELLDMREVDAILYGPIPFLPARTFQFCNSYGVSLIRSTSVGRRRANYVKFGDLESAVLKMLPREFPVADAETGLWYRDSLLLLRKNEIANGTKNYLRCMFDVVEQGDIASRLGKRSALSIFVKHGYTEDDGAEIWINTHQFRHYLNTLAQGANVDQLDIARWSGRRDVRQNKAYDHTSGRDLLERVRDAITGDKTGFGPLTHLHKVTLVPRDEFARLHIPTAHTTDYGHCIHDFTMLPCQVHQDCVNCNESICIKGDETREQNIRKARDETRLLLARAEVAHADGEAGVDRWLAHQKLTYERLDNLCQILDDPRVPVGAVIQLSGVVPASRLALAAQQRIESDGNAAAKEPA